MAPALGLTLCFVAAGCVGSVTSASDDGARGLGGTPGRGPVSPGTGSGTRGAPGGNSGPSAQSAAFSCGGRWASPDEGMRRLSARQYRNTLRDLTSWSLGSDEAGNGTMMAIDPALAQLPEDESTKLGQHQASYRRVDQDVEGGLVDAWYQVAVATARHLTAPERAKTVIGACLDAFDAACLDRFVRGFGSRALRRPLDDAEVAYYRGFYGDTTKADAAALADVIAALLSAPQFLYLVEHGRPGTEPVSELTAFELAARLSYHFWDTMPDEALWNAAESGALSKADEYARQVDRLFADSRTRATLREFYRDWLKLEALEPLDGQNKMPLFKAFAGTALPSSLTHRNMIEEVLDLVDHLTWKQPGGFGELLTSDLAFAKTKDLADIYGLPAWDGQGAPPAFPRGQRPGLLTRAAFLATGTASTRPVVKGVFIRENLLCDEIPAPPENAAAATPELSPTLSTRQVVEALTEKDAACAACHKPLINPLGFALEGFDALGRVRTKQRLFAEDGKPTGEVDVDTRSIPQVVVGDMTPSNGPADLMRLIVDSGKGQACLVRHYFRFSFGRPENLTADGCVLDRMHKALVEKKSLAAMLKEVALAPNFRQRAFQ